MQRVTVTIDDELMSALDRYMEAGGHQNRSEAVRDLVRAGLLKQPRAGRQRPRLHRGAGLCLRPRDAAALEEADPRPPQPR